MSKYENVETVIDRFLDYVNSNKRVSLSTVASALAISSSQAERIAILLEQSGFVEIHYGITDVVLSSKKIEVASKVQKEARAGKNKVIEQSKEIEREVLTAENLLKFFESDIGRRIEIAELLLKDIENEDELHSLADVEEVEKQVDLALGQLAAFSSEVKTLADTEEQFYKQLTEFKEKLQLLKTNKQVKQELNLIQRIIQWIKSLFTKAKKKPLKVTHKKKLYDQQTGVTFVGHGGFQFVKKRPFKLRSGRVRQHYWKKRKHV